MALGDRCSEEKNMNRPASYRVVLAASLLALCVPLVIQPARSATTDVTLTGTVSCSRCRGLHSRKGTNRLSCTMLCVSQDSHYVLLVGDKVYALEGDKNKIQNFGGGNATVTGRVLRKLHLAHSDLRQQVEGLVSIIGQKDAFRLDVMSDEIITRLPPI